MALQCVGGVLGGSTIQAVAFSLEERSRFSGRREMEERIRVLETKTGYESTNKTSAF